MSAGKGKGGWRRVRKGGSQDERGEGKRPREGERGEGRAQGGGGEGKGKGGGKERRLVGTIPFLCVMVYGGGAAREAG